jgi:hypothetical protein
MAFEIFTALIPLLGAIIGAVLGGYAGAVFAVRRHQSQRAFDRRIEWYESVLATLRRNDRRLRAIAFAPPPSDAESAKRRWGVLPDVLADYYELGDQADLYADSRSAHLLNQVIIDVEKIATLGVRAAQAPDAPDNAQNQVLEDLSKLLRLGYSRAHREIASQARAILGYEPISRKQSPD